MCVVCFDVEMHKNSGLGFPFPPLKYKDTDYMCAFHGKHHKHHDSSSAMAASSSAALTEANVEARDFRLDFAQETLQSFKRDRSRSPLRLEPLRDPARAALDVVCKRDTDRRVDDQRATIARLQQELAAKDQEIKSLQNGDGPIGPILLRKMSTSGALSDKHRNLLMSKNESVYHFMRRMGSLASSVQDELTWGEHYDFLSRGRAI